MKKKRGKKSIDVIRTLGEIDVGMTEKFGSPESKCFGQTRPEHIF